jgi:glutamate dehydrogenase/leucine dehydrogenase
MFVACSDTRGTLRSPDGLDVDALISLKETGKSVIDFPRRTTASVDAIIDGPCDIWVPAVRPNLLTRDNVHRLKARIVAQGVNIPCTPEAEATLESRGILLLPDFLDNAGGVIRAAVEYHSGSESTAFSGIDEKLRRNTALVNEKSRGSCVSTREAAVALAAERIRNAERVRRWHGQLPGGLPAA